MTRISNFRSCDLRATGDRARFNMLSVIVLLPVEAAIGDRDMSVRVSLNRSNPVSGFV